MRLCDPKRERKLAKFFERHANLLRRQGSIQGTYRRMHGVRYGPFYRVILRVDGAQRSVYVGGASSLVDEARSRLAELQHEKQGRIESLQRRREGKRLMRQLRRQIDHLVRREGLFLKGTELRGMRARRHGVAVGVPG